MRRKAIRVRLWNVVERAVGREKVKPRPVVRREVVDEEHPVEVIDLVEESPGESASDQSLVRYPFRVLVANLGLSRPLAEESETPRKRQATFLLRLELIGGRNHLWVHATSVGLRVEAPREHAQQDPHLIARDALCASRVHPRAHAVEQHAEFVIEGGHRLCHLPQDRVTEGSHCQQVGHRLRAEPFPVAGHGEALDRRNLPLMVVPPRRSGSRQPPALGRRRLNVWVTEAR